jgi:hypothetical protein
LRRAAATSGWPFFPERYASLYAEDEFYLVADAEQVRDHVRRGWVLLDEGITLKGD